MRYLKSFTFPDRDREDLYFEQETAQNRRTCYTTKYPFHVFRYRHLPELQFAPLTILYGGNGSGKTTMLNLIAEKLRLQRGAVFNRSDFYEDYLDLCRYRLSGGQSVPEGSRIITSDDVFDYLLEIRGINDEIDKERAHLLDQYHQIGRAHV